MSTTVTYKGNTIATVDNNTKTLETQGKYCESDIVLTDVSISELSTSPSTTNGIRSSDGKTIVIPNVQKDPTITILRTNYTTEDSVGVLYVFYYNKDDSSTSLRGWQVFTVRKNSSGQIISGRYYAVNAFTRTYDANAQTLTITLNETQMNLVLFSTTVYYSALHQFL